MNRGKGQVQSRLGGYTIVETMIFLAVSAVMFLIAIQFVSGQQNKADFINTVRNFETKLTDTANDVATGYYQGGGTFSCKQTSGLPDAIAYDPLNGQQGASKDCIFVGTVLKFGDSGDRSKYVQFTAAGLRLDGSNNIVTKLVDAKPTVFSKPETYSIKDIGYGVTVQCVSPGTTCASGPSNSQNAAFGFFTKIMGTSASGGNNIQTDLFTYTSPSIVNSVASDVPNINAANYDYSNTAQFNPTNGVTVCLKSGGTKQYALIHIGNGGNNLTVSTEIKNYSGGTPPCV